MPPENSRRSFLDVRAHVLNSSIKLTKTSADHDIYHYDVNTKVPHELLAYSASKSRSLSAAEDFIKTNKPSYDVVFLMPSLLLGNNPLAKTRRELFSGSNAPLLGTLLGQFGRPILDSSVSLEDTVRLHVVALDTSIPAGRYLVASNGPEGAPWGDAISIVKKYFPEASGKVFATDETPTVVPLNVDFSKTEKAFGIKFQSFEEQVKSVTENYLALD